METTGLEGHIEFRGEVCLLVRSRNGIEKEACYTVGEYAGAMAGIIASLPASNQ